MTSILALSCLLALAQSLPPNPEAIPPSIERRMILTMPRLTPAKRLEQYRAAQRRTMELQNQILTPMQRRLNATPYERKLIWELAMAVKPEVFLFDGPELKFLLGATDRMKRGVSPSIQRVIGNLYQSPKAPEPVIVEVFKNGKLVKKK